MASPASIGKHPIHPMLVVFPIALWVFSFIADIIYRVGGQSRAIWNEIAYYTLAGGIIGALLAAVPGLIDLFSLRDRSTKRLGVKHMITNVTALLIFGASLWARTTGLPGAGLPVLLSAIGIIVVSYGGWLGGEMVYVKGVGVEQPTAQRSRREEYPYYGDRPEHRPPTRPQ